MPRHCLIFFVIPHKMARIVHVTFVALVDVVQMLLHAYVTGCMLHSVHTSSFNLDIDIALSD